MRSEQGGLIMPAYALPLPELRLRPIPAQLRPDDRLKHRSDPAHWHPAELPPSGTEILFKGKPVPEERWSTAWAMRLHIVSRPDHGKELAAELGHRTKDELGRLVSDERYRDDLDRAREGLLIRDDRRGGRPGAPVDPPARRARSYAGRGPVPRRLHPERTR